MPTALSHRWNQILKYCSSIEDIEAIAYQRGSVKLYHGAPTEFARILVAEGPRVPYKIEDVGRHVAKVYGIRWMELAPYAYRKREVVQMLSTAPATIAARWAWSFPLGEVLTDLNSHARIMVAALQVHRSTGMKYRDAVDFVMEKADSLAKQLGIVSSMENRADILGLPDKFVLEEKTGSIVEVLVNTSLIPQRLIDSTRHDYEAARKYMTVRDTLIDWNYNYRDIKIPRGAILSSRIVVTGMKKWEQNAIEAELKAGRLPALPARLERV